MPALPDHWLKYHHARRHLDDLRTCVDEWLRTPGNRSEWFERDPTDPHALLVMASARDLPTDPVSLMLGDIVHNFRCCLDQVAYALACRHTGTLSPEVAAASMFPIVGHEDRHGSACDGAKVFQARRPSSLQAVHPKAQDVIDGYQPYQRGAAYAQDPLWHLATLSNLDKHRALHVATSYPHVFTIDPSRRARTHAPIVHPNAWPLTFAATGTRVTTNTLVARITTRPTVAGETRDVELGIEPSIAFVGPPVEHEDVFELLQGIETGVAAVIGDLNKFF